MSRGSSEVTVRLSAEGKEKLIGALREIGTEGEKMARHLEKSGQPASKGLLAVNAASREVQAGMQGMASRAGPLGSALAAVGPAGLAAAAGLAAVAASAAFAFSKAREGMEFADEIDTASKRLGIGAEALQEYRAALIVTGDAAANFDEGARSLLERMGEFARTGQGEGAQIFKKLNIDVRDAHGNIKSLEEILPELADKIKGVGSEAEQADIANKLFGGQGQNMLALMRQGGDEMQRLRDQMRDMGVVMDEQVVRRYAEASDKAQILSQAMKVQLTSAFVDLAPVITSTLGVLNEFAKAMNDIADSFHSLENQSTERLKSQLEEMVKYRDELVKEQAKGGGPGVFAQLIAGLYGGTADNGAAQVKMINDTIDRIEKIIKDRKPADNNKRKPPGFKPPNPNELAIAALQRQIDTFGDKRQQAIDGALKGLNEQATNEQRQALAELAGKLYDMTAAEKALADAHKKRLGVIQKGEAVRQAQMTDDEKLEAEYKRLMDLMSQGAITSGTFDRAMQSAREQFDPMTRAIKEMSDSLAETTINTLANVRSFKDLGDVLDQVATQFLNMALQAIAYQPLQSAFSGFLTGMVSPTAHTGGIAGEMGGHRTLSPLTFMGAERFHSGGFPGLRPSEVPIIAERGEEVITRNDPRHMLNLFPRQTSQKSREGNVTVNVYPVEGTKAEVSTSRDPNGGLNVDVVMRQMEDKMAGRIGQGRSPMNGAMERRYGLNPAKNFQR